MLIASQDKSGIQNLRSLLSSEFEMKDVEVAEKILGMEITKYWAHKHQIYQICDWRTLLKP